MIALFTVAEFYLKLMFCSKRSQSADHSLNDKINRDKANLARKLHLLNILRDVDTSGQLAAVSDQSGIPTTVTTSIRHHADGSGSESGSKRRKNKNRKGRKGKKNNKKRGSKKARNNRKRRIRAVADDVVELLQSEHGEAILQAIVGALDDDYEYNGDVEELEQFVKKTAKKCKCSKSRKSKN